MILVVAGIFALFRRQILWGIVLIIVGLLVGPGGVSIFNYPVPPPDLPKADRAAANPGARRPARIRRGRCRPGLVLPDR